MPDAFLDPALPPDLSGWERLRRPIWLYDPVSLRGLYANAAAIALWGADSLEALLARDFSKASPAVRARTDRLAKVTAAGAVVTERWSFFPGGRPVAVNATISAFEMLDGRKVLQFEATPVDVGHAELRAVEALRHTSGMISLFDAQGRSTLSNPAAFDAYGDAGLDFADRFLFAADGEAALAQVLGGEPLAEVLPVRTAHGERWHYLDARQVVDPVTGEAGVLLSERDLTSQVEAERALEDARERAEVAMAKQRFLANMSHELRTPLNSVIGFAGLLSASPLDADQASHVERIVKAGEVLLRMVNDVIDLSELDGGAVTLHPAPFDLPALLDQALGAVEMQATAKRLTLALEIDDDAPAWVVGDAERLNTAIAHFLDNAVKFTDAGGVRLRLQAQPDGQGAADIEISVIDTGPGLEPAARARLFRRFSQADESDRRRFGGGGLGLAVSRELVALMGGDVGVDSAPGEGARFWLRVSLPLHDQADAAARAERAGPLKVLYADDHEANRVLVSSLLASLGHQCDTVCDGAEAVGAVREGAYDLVLMDIQMPVQDGLGAAAEIRALAGSKAKVPILALTANTLSDQRATYAAAGMNDCIAKPVNLADLYAKVTYWASAESAAAQTSAA